MNSNVVEKLLVLEAISYWESITVSLFIYKMQDPNNSNLVLGSQKIPGEPLVPGPL